MILKDKTNLKISHFMLIDYDTRILVCYIGTTDAEIIKIDA